MLKSDQVWSRLDSNKKFLSQGQKVVRTPFLKNAASRENWIIVQSVDIYFGTKSNLLSILEKVDKIQKQSTLVWISSKSKWIEEGDLK